MYLQRQCQKNAKAKTGGHIHITVLIITQAIVNIPEVYTAELSLGPLLHEDHQRHHWSFGPCVARSQKYLATHNSLDEWVHPHSQSHTHQEPCASQPSRQFACVPGLCRHNLVMSEKINTCITALDINIVCSKLESACKSIQSLSLQEYLNLGCKYLLALLHMQSSCSSSALVGASGASPS